MGSHLVLQDILLKMTIFNSFVQIFKNRKIVPLTGLTLNEVVRWNE